MNTIPDVMTPYTYQANRLKSKDYKGVITKDIVYKKYKDYELILTVDFAETNKAQNSLQGKSFGGTIIVGAAGTALK